jgi:hypothetical protein
LPFLNERNPKRSQKLNEPLSRALLSSMPVTSCGSLHSCLRSLVDLGIAYATSEMNLSIRMTYRNNTVVLRSRIYSKGLQALMRRVALRREDDTFIPPLEIR